VSTLKEESKIVHDETDFKTDYAGITKPGEFKYTHGGSVQPGLDYHIHYTNDKREVYMIGGSHTYSSKIIERVINNSLFSTYTNLTGAKSKLPYPSKYSPNPSESDYRIGTITRCFTQKANNLNGELFEINISDIDANSLFRYITLEWIISGTRSEVELGNMNTMINISRIRGNEQIINILFPLQLWIPPKNSQEDLEEKLNRLKII
tara:strand:+ start:1014 stop:1634 length:621 start_codon:yes stop_codon:yes gene_type:complete